MSLIMSAEAMRQIVAKTDVRKKEIAEKMNGFIEEQSRKGLRFAAIIPGLVKEERDWLIDELAIMGYDVNASNGDIKW